MESAAVEHLLSVYRSLCDAAVIYDKLNHEVAEGFCKLTVEEQHEYINAIDKEQLGL